MVLTCTRCILLSPLSTQCLLYLILLVYKHTLFMYYHGWFGQIGLTFWNIAKKKNIGSKTRVRVLFLAAGCFSAKFICIFRNIFRNKKVVAAWFKQGAPYFLNHFLLFIFFTVIKYNSGDINLLLQIFIKLIKIFDLWIYHMVHVDMSACTMMVPSWWQETATRMTSILR